MKKKYLIIACSVPLILFTFFQGLSAHVNASPNFLELAKKSVVRISILGSSTCSATIINDKQALTAAHCIPSNEEFFMYLISTQKPPMYLVASKLETFPLISNERLDAAIIQGNFASLHKADVDLYSAEIFKVDKAVLCGYPLFSNTLRCDVANRVGNSFFTAKFDIPGLPGQSGGAVFSMDGRLIGIIQSVDDNGHTRAGSTTGVLSLAPLPQ